MLWSCTFHMLFWKYKTSTLGPCPTSSFLHLPLSILASSQFLEDAMLISTKNLHTFWPFARDTPQTLPALHQASFLFFVCELKYHHLRSTWPDDHLQVSPCFSTIVPHQPLHGRVLSRWAHGHFLHLSSPLFIMRVGPFLFCLPSTGQWSAQQMHTKCMMNQWINWWINQPKKGRAEGREELP